MMASRSLRAMSCSDELPFDRGDLCDGAQQPCPPGNDRFPHRMNGGTIFFFSLAAFCVPARRPAYM
jgi:hypothetical protein